MFFCITHHLKAGINHKGYNRREEIKKTLQEIRAAERLESV